MARREKKTNEKENRNSVNGETESELDGPQPIGPNGLSQASAEASTPAVPPLPSLPPRMVPSLLPPPPGMCLFWKLFCLSNFVLFTINMFLIILQWFVFSLFLPCFLKEALNSFIHLSFSHVRISFFEVFSNFEKGFVPPMMMHGTMPPMMRLPPPMMTAMMPPGMTGPGAPLPPPPRPSMPPSTSSSVSILV